MQAGERIKSTGGREFLEGRHKSMRQPVIAYYTDGFFLFMKYAFFAR
jgi:hypothetical protein